MPQSPLNLNSITPLGVMVPQQLDAQGAERVSTVPSLTRLNITAPTVVKAAPGRISRVNVIVAGTAPGGVYDCLTTAAAVVGTQIASVPPLTTAQAGGLAVEASAQIGITVIPGAGQTLAVIYE